MITPRPLTPELMKKMIAELENCPGVPQPLAAPWVYKNIYEVMDAVRYQNTHQPERDWGDVAQSIFDTVRKYSYLPFDAFADILYILQQADKPASSWFPIDQLGSDLVELWAPHPNNRYRVIGFRAEPHKGFVALNFNDDPDGSFVLDWTPTHFRYLHDVPFDKPVKVKRKEAVWKNYYNKPYDGRFHSSRYSSDVEANGLADEGFKRIACKEIEIEYFEGEGL